MVLSGVFKYFYVLWVQPKLRLLIQQTFNTEDSSGFISIACFVLALQSNYLPFNGSSLLLSLNFFFLHVLSTLTKKLLLQYE